MEESNRYLTRRNVVAGGAIAALGLGGLFVSQSGDPSGTGSSGGSGDGSGAGGGVTDTPYTETPDPGYDGSGGGSEPGTKTSTPAISKGPVEVEGDFPPFYEARLEAEDGYEMVEMALDTEFEFKITHEGGDDIVYRHGDMQAGQVGNSSDFTLFASEWPEDKYGEERPRELDLKVWGGYPPWDTLPDTYNLRLFRSHYAIWGAESIDYAWIDYRLNGEKNFEFVGTEEEFANSRFSEEV